MSGVFALIHQGELPHCVALMLGMSGESVGVINGWRVWGSNSLGLFTVGSVGA